MYHVIDGWRGCLGSIRSLTSVTLFPAICCMPHAHRELDSSPVLVHTKIISINGDIAVIGSRDLDLRSLELDLRVSLVCYNRGVVAELQQLFADELRLSRRLHLHEWRAAR